MKFLNLINKYIMSSNHYAKKLGVKIGNNCTLAKSINYGSEPYLISIGDNFYSSSNINFVTHDGSVNVLRNLHPEYKDIDIIDKIEIGNNVFLGINVVILQGTKIEDNVIVGANSLVKGFLKKNSVYAGSPVKFICTIDEYLEKNKEKFINTKKFSKEEKMIYLLKKYNNG